MIPRRGFLATAMSFAALPLMKARAGEQHLTLNGGLEQGSLVVGKTNPEARVAIDSKVIEISERGFFAFGIAYDRTTALQMDVSYPDGGVLMQDVVPVVRKFETQAINGLPPAEVTPPPELLARIAAEKAKIEATRKSLLLEDWYADGFDWPVPGIISSPFGNRRILNGVPKQPHFGIDIAAKEGTPILAPAEANVLLAEPDFFYDGGITVLDHGQGVTTTYLHQSKLDVATGDHVTRGQKIGEVGHTGRATGPHLCWRLNWFEVQLDPSRSTLTPAPKAA
jgi:murein DD-endopeptidase MepM/ murein hydrolase activator NlpD